jgi:hypothetical protein
MPTSTRKPSTPHTSAPHSTRLCGATNWPRRATTASPFLAQTLFSSYHMRWLCCELPAVARAVGRDALARDRAGAYAASPRVSKQHCNKELVADYILCASCRQHDVARHLWEHFAPLPPESKQNVTFTDHSTGDAIRFGTCVCYHVRLLADGTTADVGAEVIKAF